MPGKNRSTEDLESGGHKSECQEIQIDLKAECDSSIVIERLMSAIKEILVTMDDSDGLICLPEEEVRVNADASTVDVFSITG